MNDRFLHSNLDQLMQHNGMPAISIYIPTHRITTYIDEDKIYLKNQLAEAEEQCVEAGMRRPDVRKILQPGHDLLEDNLDFWIHLSDGMALFLAEGIQEFYRLPRTFDPLTVVANRFHIKPLVPLLTNDGRFYVLAVSQNDVRFLEGTRYAVDQINLDQIPTSLAEALRFEEIEQQMQHHTSGSGAGGTGAPTMMFHGHGGDATDDDKNRILRYFQQIDRGLREFLGDEQTPLVFAGVDYLMPIYQKANTYNYLVDQHIAGNPEELSEEELHDQAWSLISPIFKRDQEQILEQYHREAGTGKTTTWLDEGLVAAFQGRMLAAFIPQDVHAWGTFDPSTMEIHRQEEETVETQDLYDLLAAYTLMHDGQVYVCEPEEVPSENEIAAVYRF